MQATKHQFADIDIQKLTVCLFFVHYSYSTDKLRQLSDNLRFKVLERRASTICSLLTLHYMGEQKSTLSPLFSFHKLLPQTCGHQINVESIFLQMNDLSQHLCPVSFNKVTGSNRNSARLLRQQPLATLWWQSRRYNPLGQNFSFLF